MTVYGDGKQTKAFTYVKDVAQTLMSLIENDDAFGEVFNVGGTQEIAIIDLAKQVIEKTGSKSEIKLIPYDEAFGKDFEDMQRRVPNIDKIRKFIDFEPRTSLDVILRHIIDHMRK